MIQDDDPTSVEYIHVVQELESGAKGNVTVDLPVGAFLSRTACFTFASGGTALLHELIRLPHDKDVKLASDSRIMIRERIIPDWRRIELKGNFGRFATSLSMERWNVDVVGRVLHNLAQACVDLGYDPRYHRQAPDLVWPLVSENNSARHIFQDVTVRHRRRTRTARFQVQHGAEVKEVARQICLSHGLPISLAPWLEQIFYSGPGDPVSLHLLARAGQINRGPMVSVALRLNQEQWGSAVYEPGNWISSRVADQLIPLVADFVVRGNIRLFSSRGFEAFGPYLTQLRHSEALGHARGESPRSDSNWAIRIQDTAAHAPRGWIPVDAASEQLDQEGDFLIAGNLAYFGSRQLRRVGGQLRSVWEAAGGNGYVVSFHRPPTARGPDAALLNRVAKIALGIEQPRRVDRDRARDLTENHIRAYRRAYRSEPRSRQEMIQRVLARWEQVPEK